MSNTDKTTIGDRMKLYESVTRTYLMPRGYVCIRVDGRSFSQYTKGLNRPFDKGLMDDMDATAMFLCENIQNAKVGFVQSDEISVITFNANDLGTQTFFDGNIQKISSVVASMATVKFNQLRWQKFIEKKSMDLLSIENKLAMFDCRCWNVPNHWEAYNTLVWRQQDAIRNSISSVSQFHHSHKELHGKSQSDMHEMLHQKGINWATDFTDGEKNGRVIVKESYITHEPNDYNGCSAVRTRWVAKGAWVFTKDEGKLLEMIPQYEN